jgi:hypothetical protein
LKIFHRVTLYAAAGLTAGLSACASSEPASGPDWLEERAAIAARRAPPAHVPVHILDTETVISVRATTRLLMERGEYVRTRGAAIAAREVDTEAFAQQALQRATPPADGSAEPGRD